MALCNLAGNADNQVEIARQGGIAAVLKALDNHPTAPAVQEHACWALLNIGWADGALQRRIKQAGAVERVRLAMSAHNATASTREKGQQLLDRLERV